MCSANLERVRSIYAAWENGDFGGGSWADPQIEFASADGTSPGSVTGLAAMAKEYGGWLDAWDDFRFIPEEYSELDDGRVLVLCDANASAKSHAELDEADELDAGDPVAERYRDIRAQMPHMAVFGGCCGTDYRHTAEFCHALPR